MPAPIVVIDSETSGLSPDKGAEVIELGAIALDSSTLAEVGRWESGVLGVTPQAVLNPRSLEVSGITFAEIRAGRNPAEAFASFVAWLKEMGAPGMFVAHNEPFDRKFVDAGLKLHAPYPPFHLLFPVSFCTMAAARRATGRGKLVEVCEHWGIKNRDAHRAMADVEATCEVLRRLVAAAPGILPPLPVDPAAAPPPSPSPPAPPPPPAHEAREVAPQADRGDSEEEEGPRITQRPIWTPAHRGPGPEWSAEAAELVAWFAPITTGHLPPPPWALEWGTGCRGDVRRPSQVVANPDLFLSALRGDVAAGPGGPRARTGALVDDLLRLREIIAAHQAGTLAAHPPPERPPGEPKQAAGAVA